MFIRSGEKKRLATLQFVVPIQNVRDDSAICVTDVGASIHVVDGGRNIDRFGG